jgi:inosine/xanthosine triphosphate pyrophosphatase family protein
MKKVLFATTNKNKIVRLKNFLRDTDLEIISLSDLNYKIDEPEEIGKNPIEIAQNKASYYWENLVDKVPVIAQDDTIEFLGVPELKSPRLSIKSPVIKMYGEFNDSIVLLLK